jgi:hypothetical protein
MPLRRRLELLWYRSPFYREPTIGQIEVDLYETNFMGRMRDPEDPELVARLSSKALHQWIGRAITPASKSLLASELRRRETHNTHRLSVAALIVSLAALVVSIVKP